MSKKIVYSLFNSQGTQNFEKLFYVCGMYWNCRMNAFLFPDWQTHLEIGRDIYDEFQGLFDWLVSNNNLSISVMRNETLRVVRACYAG